MLIPMEALAAKTPYAVLSDDNTVLTFYYDENKDSRGGMGVGPFWEDYKAGIGLFPNSGWYPFRKSITTVVFDDSFASCNDITSTSYWFYGCENLVAISGIGNLKTNKVKSMYCMFYGCSSLQILDVSGFNTENVTEMGSMFENCFSLTELNVSGFKTGNVKSMSSMFYYCKSLTSLDVSGFDTSNVTNMYFMFGNCSGLTTLDVSRFDTSKVTMLYGMFYGCSKLEALDVSGFNTENVKNIGGMFSQCSSLTSLDVSNFDTSKVKDFSSMFYYCSNLQSLNVSNFKTDNATDMAFMFAYCSNLKDIDVSNFNTANVTSMAIMFAGCSSLTHLNVSNFKTDNVKEMGKMFYFCTGMKSLDVSSFTLDSATDISEIFSCCTNITTIYVGKDNWNTSNVTDGTAMFYNCFRLIGGNGTIYDPLHIGMEYARIDKEGTPGYLTAIEDKNALYSLNTETTIATDGLSNEDLSDNVVDDVYYNVGNGGYDASDGSVVIGQTTNMGQITDATPGSEDVKNNFNGLILKVAKGKGTIKVNVKTTGNAQLVVQVGNQTPMIATKTEKGDVVVGYDVAEDTYVYIYAIIGSSSAPATHRAAPADAVKIYGITVTPGATGISTIQSSQPAVDSYYTLDGRKVQGQPAEKGVYVVNGRKVVIK